MKYDRWRPKKRVEQEYLEALSRLMGRAFVRPFMKAKNPDELLKALREAFANSDFHDAAHAAAARMITGTAVESARTWRLAAAEGMQSRMIHEALLRELNGPVGQRMREIVQKNAQLITSVPGEIAQSLEKFIAEEAEGGKRASEISNQIRERFEYLTETRIALIARTETSKASTALTRSRSEQLDLDWYVWRTSGDARVRDAHRKMNLVLVNWNDTPAPESIAHVKSSLGHYHAGDCPNCRCYPQPVISLNRLEWPMKVHIAGDIRRMTRARFEDLIGERKAA